ncbi:MAG: DNA polymerase III subunit beta [Patescibacteria group bacterium UBA2103]
MNIEITHKDVQHAVRGAARVVQKNPQLPVLGCVVIVAENNKVHVRATNLEVGVEYILPGKVIEEGEVAIPAGVLTSFVGTLKADTMLSLKSSGDTITAKTKQGSTKIKTISSEDFPSLPKAEGTTFGIPAPKLMQSFDSVAFCASQSMIRPELASIYLRGTEDGLISAATDSFRLAEKKVPVQKNTEFDPILVPAKNVPDILSVLDGAENVSVSLDEHHVTFDTGKGFVTSRLTSGNFPDYTQILPKSYTTHATMLTQDLLNALKTVAIFSDNFSKVSVDVSPSEKKFLLLAQNMDTGETVETVSAALEGDDISINFNHRYISEVYQVIQNDSTQLSFAGPGKPLLIQGVGDTSFIYIVMPMNR